ncbi:MAG: pyrroline-5-carboxylate reductase [Eubacterium sp.]|nr:pyrroline-5-carboxylate reductase [Eubacterium sp.]
MENSVCNLKIGFIGAGHLATALVEGLVGSGMDPALITVSNRSTEKLDALKEASGVNVTPDNSAVAKASDVLFLTVKPNMYPEIIEEIRGDVADGALVVTPAAGLKIASTESGLGAGAKVVRCMPNMPSSLGEGMNAVCAGNNVTAGDKQAVEAVFSMLGRFCWVEEELFDAVTGVSGSGPAYGYLFIDAMAKAGEHLGMSREDSVVFAAQTVLGAAKTVLESGADPSALCDKVCTPGGTTIEAVKVLEGDGIYDTVDRAIAACAARSAELGR